MKKNTTTNINRKDVFIKYVKKANMWCKTYWDDIGNQKQVWSTEKEKTNTIEKNSSL